MADIFVLPLIEFERELGYESRIISSLCPAGIDSGSVIHYDLSLRNLFLLPYSFLRLCVYLREYNPDLVVSHNSKSSLLPLMAARLMGIPSRVYFNHGVPYVAYKGATRMLLKWLDALNIKLSTDVITVSKDMKELLSATNRDKKISLIANGSACGIELGKYQPDQYDHTDFCHKYLIEIDYFIVSYIGRPEIRKGFSVALDLWLKHFSNRQNYRLFLCGPTDEDVINLIGSVPENVHPIGFVENVAEILANTDCLILPSFHEGMPYSIIEAMASGCIVLANDISGIRNLITNNVNGYLVAGNSVEHYASLIANIEKGLTPSLKRIKEKAIQTSCLYSRDIFLKAYKEHLTSTLKK